MSHLQFAKPDGAGLVYVTSGFHAEIHHVDAEQWDPAVLSARERAVCKALLEHTLAKIAHWEHEQAIGVSTIRGGPQ